MCERDSEEAAAAAEAAGRVATVAARPLASVLAVVLLAGISTARRVAAISSVVVETNRMVVEANTISAMVLSTALALVTEAASPADVAATMCISWYHKSRLGALHRVSAQKVDINIRLSRIGKVRENNLNARGKKWMREGCGGIWCAASCCLPLTRSRHRGRESQK